MSSTVVDSGKSDQDKSTTTKSLDHISEKKNNDESKENNEDAEEVRCFGKWKIPNGDLLMYWTENTTFNGVKFIAENTEIHFRRVVWLVVFMACLIVFIKYVADRVEHYNERPVQVNIEINDNGSLPFPTVTICKQNAFSLTKSVKKGLYRALLAAFDNDTSALSRTVNSSWVFDRELSKIFTETAFRLHDFIIDCDWSGIPCSSDNFTFMMTQSGICASFNKKGPELFVSDTGVQSGLNVLLNLESYNYMVSPYGSSDGLRVHLHPRNTYPFINDKGLAVSVGTHTYVGTSALINERLPPPHGLCGKRKQLFGGAYTERNCEALCYASHIQQKCGCREFFIYRNDSHKFGPVCTLRQQMDCVIPNMKIIRSMQEELCDCTIECKEETFDSLMSFSSISKLTKHDILHRSDEFIRGLRKKRREARDLRCLVEQSEHEGDVAAMQNHLLTFERVHRFVTQEAPNTLSLLDNFLYKELQYLRDVHSIKLQLYQKQVEVLERLFVAPFEVANENALKQVGHEMYEFIFRLEECMKNLMSLPRTEVVPRENIYFRAYHSVEVRRISVTEVLKDLSHFFQCYSMGQICRNITKLSGNETWAQLLAAIPKRLLANSMIDSEVVLQKVRENLNAFYVTLTQLMDILFVAYGEGRIDTAKLNMAKTVYIQQIKLWLFQRQDLQRMFYKPLEDMKRSMNYFQDLLEVIINIEKTLSTNRLHILGLMKDKEETEIRRITDVLSVMRHYVAINTDEIGSQPISPNVTLKSVLAEKYLSERSSTLRFRNHFLRHHTSLVEVRENIEESCPILRDFAKRMWQMVDEDDDAVELYKERGLYGTFYLPPLQSLQRQDNITEKYDHIIQDATLNRKHRYPPTSLADDLKKFEESLEQYLKDNDIDGEFCSESLVKLSFYYRKLNIVKITQQKAYTYSSLLSDIGGTMGLFIGGSVLGFWEFIDIILLLSVRLWKKRHPT